MTDRIKKAKQELGALKERPPMKTTAVPWSDRTAAVMAILSEVVYEKFDEENRDIAKLVADTVGLLTKGEKGKTADSPSAEQIEKKLLDFAVAIQNPVKDGSDANSDLRNALAAFDYQLAGVFNSPSAFQQAGFRNSVFGWLKAAWRFVSKILRGNVSGFAFLHDTQGMIVVRPPKSERTGPPPTDDVLKDPGEIVIVFRGTQQMRDWLTNINTSKREVEAKHRESGKVFIGNFHAGFYEALDSVWKQIQPQIQAANEIAPGAPVYLTGHSLGGALATIATWRLEQETDLPIASCYTFGAPRCGDKNLTNSYATPIHRVVNGGDPVPFVPPSYILLDIFKIGARLIPNWGERIAKFLVQRQKFQHYGQQRYLPMLTRGPDGRYPDFELRMGVHPLERVARTIARIFNGGVRNPAYYHSMGIYRRKLIQWYKR